ncbi:TIGR04222 domain-containing membrane protein [Qipengyuania sp.]|uniref:TIGR04222 domain-containing membrane protein n=1 Tax=Qipengyuania sp. TaxID=2004515 RepID=UPI003BABBC15
MIEGFSTYSGGEFLVFYALLVIGAIIAGVWLPGFLRADGENRRVDDRYDMAYLAGGARRVTETVLAQLLGTGSLEAAGGNKVRVAHQQGGENALENDLLRKVTDFGLTEAQRTVGTHIDEIQERLARTRLLLDQSERLQLRIVSVLPYLAVLAVGWYRRSAGIAEGEPVGYLTGLMILAAILGSIRFIKLDPRTRGGLAAVAEGKAISSRLKSAPTGPELGFGVALFGTAILAGTPFSQLHAMRQAASGDGGGYSSDGGDSSSSDGGGCGGGCGGCGG